MPLQFFANEYTLRIWVKEKGITFRQQRLVEE